jgi:hypothetical protein
MKIQIKKENIYSYSLILITLIVGLITAFNIVQDLQEAPRTQKRSSK